MTTEKGKGKERDQGTKYGRWGFVLPETTMMKSHRASWRSAREFVTVHDASYSSVFRLGARVAVSDGLSSDAVNSTLLGRLSDSLSRAGFANVLAFATDTSQSIRVLDTVLTHQGADPNHSSTAAALAPVRIVLLSGARCFSKSALVQDKLAYIRKEALVFAHPAADLHVRRALKAAGIIMVDEKKNGLFELVAPATNVVQTYASQLDSAPDPWLAAGGKDSSLSKLEKKRRRQAYRAGSAKTSITTDTNGLADSKQGSTLLDDEAELRRKQGYNIFELIGPRAAPLLQAVLRLAQGSSGKDDEIKLRRFLSKKDGTGTAMVEVRVNDPRLSYPPKLKPLSTDADASSEASKDTEEVKSDELFWMGAKPPRFSKGEIDSRRALNTISGSRLQPDSRDDAVPVVIVRDRVVQKPSVDRYTLIVPRGWGMAFFLSLVATHQSGASSGARVLGQHQLKHQRLELAALSSAAGTSKQGAEAGMLSYPHNWIGTQTYAPWLVANAGISKVEAALSASSLASAMVAVKLHAIRKGTVMPLSSLMLASSFDDHLSWIQHLDPIDHPAAVINRNSTGGSKIDKQHLKTLIERRCEIMQLGRSAPATSTVSKRKDARIPADNAWSKYLVEASDPEELHDRSADWNNAIGTVLDGDYSLGNGKGFGIGAVTLRAWVEVLDRQRRIEALKVEDKGRRQPRNPVETTNLLLMREPGTSVVRAVSASVIPLM
uniref:POP1 C-terminal domain-containing protein n=1 Tax=Kalmanozyma brasiliensis (strain GHG001) TaxID=1365824 RepID=V5E461_KALBG